MTTPSSVVEVTSFTSPANRSDYDGMFDAGVVGVIFKVSQGLAWRWPDADGDMAAARDAGLLVGVIHYLEPAKNDPTDEVAQLLPRLSTETYELGVALEVELPLPDDPFGFSTALSVALDAVRLAGHEAGLRCDGKTLSMLTGAPWATRWWCGEPSEMTSAVPFGVWDAKVGGWGGRLPLGGYVLTSVRGLNLGGTLVVPAAAVVSPALTVADADMGGHDTEDSQGQPDQPLPASPLDAIHEGEPTEGPDEDETPEGDEDAEDEDWRSAARDALTK